ncbi:MAG: hypothetical protein REJ23_16630 [Brevundimonas sp.]|jgi:hypothetical protein|nr:hypothetical protein [Brevundimonas sp.]
MRRRDLISAAAVLPAVAVASSAAASEDKPSGGASVNISGVGLPVISGGRIRNYVFVSMRLHLGGSATIESMRGKEAYLRDALVRAAHRTPFVVADDWTRIDGNAMSASLIRSAATICGRGSVARVEIISQAPRWRTGMRAA